MRACLIFLSLFLLIGGNLSAQQNVAEQYIALGKQLYQDGRFAEAISQFREVLIDPRFNNQKPEAYFWISKSLIALQRYEDGKRNLEFYLDNYPNDFNITEARYLEARIYYLTSQYETSIRKFAAFIEEYPRSAFVPNAYYWSGESLFALGRLSEARLLYSIVTEQFSTSSRIEAARYRIEVIDLRQREEELVRLLKWSQEESLRILEEFRDQEEYYETQIQNYQNRLSNLGTDSFSQELSNLQNQISSLEIDKDNMESTIAEKNATITNLQNSVRNLELRIEEMVRDQSGTESSVGNLSSSEEDLQRRIELLDLKEEALRLKEDIFNSMSTQNSSQ